MAASSTAKPQAQVGVGISGIRERVRQLNGQLTVESGRQGTTVRATFRLEQDRDRALATKSAQLTASA